PSCHAILRAESYEKNLADFQKRGPEWTPPVERLETIAKVESEQPSPRPEFLPKNPGKAAGQPTPGLVDPRYPTATKLSASLRAIQPFLAQLGPNGYQVL